MPRFLTGIAQITFSLPEPNLARRLSGASLLAMAESPGPTRACHWLTASDPIISKARTGPLVIKPIISLKSKITKLYTRIEQFFFLVMVGIC